MEPSTGTKRNEAEMANVTRGIRNNNPGNIRISTANWQGKIPITQNTDGAFEQFVSMGYGIRALYRLLITYFGYGLNTVDAIIDRYAPAGDNSEQARQNYKQFIRDEVGSNEIQTREEFLRLADAIMIFENSAEGFTQYILPSIEQAQSISSLNDLKLPTQPVKKKMQ